mgnify:CR=1 FL=1
MKQCLIELSDEQQSEINKVLKSKTGKTFDELLAQVKSDAKDKADASNNNTEIAQQKAKLKEQISNLKDDLADAKQTQPRVMKREKSDGKF